MVNPHVLNGGDKITPQATKIRISPEPLQIERCALVTFPENAWDTEWRISRHHVIITRSNMAAETGNKITEKRFDLYMWF